LKQTLTVILILTVFVDISFPLTGSESLKTQYLLLLKILTYDKKFLSKKSDKVIIGIVFQSNYRTSDASKDALIAAIGESMLKVEKRKVNFILMDLSFTGELEYYGKNSAPDVLFILPIRDINFSSILAYSWKFKILTFTSVPAYMDEGISTCVNMNGERPVILINRISARNEGVDFSSQLLKVARIVE
jgi:hypothetical protein